MEISLKTRNKHDVRDLLKDTFLLFENEQKLAFLNEEK